jgi:hypothetical protein
MSTAAVSVFRRLVVGAVIAAGVAVGAARATPLSSRAQTSPAPALLHNGDLIVQTESSSQSAAIREAQCGHPATHVGIIVTSGDDAFVLEAVGPVKLTRLDAFVARGARFAIYRDPRLDEAGRAAVVAAARRDLGKPYDPFFTDDEERIYCSELVWRAWRAAGLDIGRIATGRELSLDGPAVSRLLSKRWRHHPGCRQARTQAECAAVVADQPIVTPASLLQDGGLVHVMGELEVSPTQAAASCPRLP